MEETIQNNPTLNWQPQSSGADHDRFLAYAPTSLRFARVIVSALRSRRYFTIWLRFVFQAACRNNLQSFELNIDDTINLPARHQGMICFFFNNLYLCVLGDRSRQRAPTYCSPPAMGFSKPLHRGTIGG